MPRFSGLLSFNGRGLPCVVKGPLAAEVDVGMLIPSSSEWPDGWLLPSRTVVLLKGPLVLVKVTHCEAHGLQIQRSSGTLEQPLRWTQFPFCPGLSPTELSFARD